MAKSTVHNERPLSLWRNGDYLLLWYGQIISAIGTQISDLAFPFLVLGLTHSPAQAGLVGAAGALPYLIFSLPAGALIDRFDRKRVMIISDTIRAISLGSIPLALLLGELTLFQIYLVSLIEGTFFVFFNLAEVSCLPRVVRKEQLSTVASQAEVTNSLSTLFGRSLGGLLYSAGQFLPFVVDTLSYIISVCSLFFIRVSFQEERQSSRQQLGKEIWEGIEWLWHQPLLCFIALLGCVVHIVGGGLILLVIVVTQQQRIPSVEIGLILGAGGIGTFIGAVLGGFLQKHFSFAQLTISTQWLTALLFPAFLLIPNLLWIALITSLILAVMTIYGVVQFSYRLSLIPDELQGRVNSIFRLVVFAGDPLGLALTGILLQTVGATTTILLYTGTMLLLALMASLNRHLRQVPRQQ